MQEVGTARTNAATDKIFNMGVLGITLAYASSVYMLYETGIISLGETITWIGFGAPTVAFIVAMSLGVYLGYAEEARRKSTIHAAKNNNRIDE